MSVFQLIGALGGSMINYASQYSTNEANLRQVELQNKAAKEEAELAYRRSKPTNQVGNMMAAGMSRSGAINALNGGGSYTPAPVNAGQSQAPQVDTTAIVNAAQGIAQLREQKRQFNEQQKLAKEQQALEVRKQGFEEQKWKEEEPTRINTKKLQDYDIEVKEALKNHKDGNKLVEGALAENAANIAEQKLNTFKANLFAALYELPSDLVSKFMKYLKRDVEDVNYLIESIREGKLTADEVENKVENIGKLETINESSGEYWARYDSKGNLHFEKK